MLGHDVFAELRLLVADNAANDCARHTADCCANRPADHCTADSASCCAGGRATLSIRLCKSGRGSKNRENCASKQDLFRHVMYSSSLNRGANGKPIVWF